MNYLLSVRFRSIGPQTPIINMIAFVDPAVSDDTENYRQFIEDRGYRLISQLDADTLKPFLRNIKRLDVVYDDITLPVTDTEIEALRFIADNEMYRFNKASFRTVVAGLAQDDDITCETVDARPLSLVKDLKLKNVNAHIDSNIGRDADLVVMVDCQIPADDLVVHFL